MKKNALITSALVGASCLFLVGCKPVAKNAQLPPSANPTSTIPSSVPLTEKIQADICGKIPTDVIASLTGMKISVPSVTTISSVTGAKRHICNYSKQGDTANIAVMVTVIFKSESKSEAFAQLWTNQQQAQQKTMKAVPDAGTEAFIGQTNEQPVLYMLTPEAQYWIQMGKTSQNATQQAEIITKLAKAIAK